VKFHILGGGPAQLGAIGNVRRRGVPVAVSDQDRNAPGLGLADYASLASSFDAAAVENDARKWGTTHLMTTGTDQPVLTAALVSEKLNLPYFLTPVQARIVTDKKIMKNALKKAGIPLMDYAVLKQDFEDRELDHLAFPLVIKPLDSQGQRGVLKVNTPAEIRARFSELLGFSRQKEILAEEYYPSVELTVSGWADRGKALVFLITDRVTFDNGPHIGVCLSHRYPSLARDRYEELKELVQKITDVVGLTEGPLYYQILLGDRGFRVNEIACRLGGAYEEEFIPVLCGVPLMDLMVDMTLGIPHPLPSQQEIDRRLEGRFLSLQMFFYRSGTLVRQEGMDEVLSREGILGGRFLLKEGTVILPRINSTQRAGYFIVTGESPEQVNRRISECYDILRAADERGESLIERDERMEFPL